LQRQTPPTVPKAAPNAPAIIMPISEPIGPPTTALGMAAPKPPTTIPKSPPAMKSRGTATIAKTRVITPKIPPLIAPTTPKNIAPNTALIKPNNINPGMKPIIAPIIPKRTAPEKASTIISINDIPASIANTMPPPSAAPIKGPVSPPNIAPRKGLLVIGGKIL